MLSEKRKIYLILSAGVAFTLMIASLLAMPDPFNYIIAIAVAGPLSACLLGLKHQYSHQPSIKE